MIQPKDRGLDDSSDHIPILYVVKNANIEVGKRIVSKTILSNKRNREEAREWYRENIPELKRRVKEEGFEGAQVIFKEVARRITEPWVKMAERKPETRSPHLNAGL